MGKKILILNGKGGVGKSTVADNIAFELQRRGYKVGFQNLDPQKGGAIHGNDYLDGTEDFVVIDTAPVIDSNFNKVAKIADIAILPSLPDRKDLDSLIDTLRRLDDANSKAQRFILVNRFDGRRIADNDFVDYLNMRDLKTIGTVPTSVDFTKASAQKTSVYEVKKSGKAAQAFISIVDSLLGVNNG